MEIIKAIIIPLIAAFAGAISAYYFQLQANRKETEKKRTEDIIRVQLILFQQYNIIKNIYDQFFKPYIKKAKGDWWSVPAINLHGYEYEQIDLASIAYVFQENSRIFNVMAIRQRVYDGLVMELIARSEFHKDQFQPKFEEFILSLENDVYTQADLYDSLGPRICDSLKASTEALPDRLMACLDGHYYCINELYKIARKALKDTEYKFLQINDKERINREYINNLYGDKEPL